jgi:hypothetical protein
MGAVVAAGLTCEYQRRQQDLGYAKAYDQHQKHPRSQFRPNPACGTFCGEHYPSGWRLNRSATAGGCMFVCHHRRSRIEFGSVLPLTIGLAALNCESV